MTGVSAGDKWVFGYGSLMWRPGFPYLERTTARLYGRRRAFCIYSVHHRGTPERRGLVLGLASGGSVKGAAYRVAAGDWQAVYEYLREREQPTETYFEAWAEVVLEGGERVQALVFLSDTNHAQWAGDLSLDQQARMIAEALAMSQTLMREILNKAPEWRFCTSRPPSWRQALAQRRIRLW